MLSGAVVPALYVKGPGERPASAMLRLTCAADRFVLRLTGGCGHMSAADAAGMGRLLTAALDGFRGGLLFGGTRMLDRASGLTLQGITEIAPAVRDANPGCVAMGVVPRRGEVSVTARGLVVADDPADAYFTVVHPDQDVCLLVQDGVDAETPWDAEWQECLRMTRDLRLVAGWSSALLAYNGGAVTEREVRAVAAQGWPVVLVAGSGRTADMLADDVGFLSDHPCVRVAGPDPASLREALQEVGAVPHGQPTREFPSRRTP